MKRNCQVNLSKTLSQARIPLLMLVVMALGAVSGCATAHEDISPPVAGNPPLVTVVAQPRDFTLPPGARIEGNMLVVEVPADAPKDQRRVHCEAPLDLGGLIAPGRGIALTVRVRGEGVSKPDARWNGVKAMIRYVDETTGATNWPRATLPIGTFDWQTATVRISDLLLPHVPAISHATLVLGLEGCTGRAEFDLSSLRLDTEEVPTARINADYVIRYPDDAGADANDGAAGAANDQSTKPTMTDALCANDVGAARQMTNAETQVVLSLPPQAASVIAASGRTSLHESSQRMLRGFMLPQRATTEDDIATIAAWGGTLVRFQICRNFLKGINDNQDLPEYAAWVDSRLDNLADVLRWCGARGMKVCVDLHVVPGGRRAGDREMNMFHDAKWADAFVGTWRRIATRFARHPAIYGYDLVNEPYQHGPAPISYWEIQRRAAEAVREIDPETAIIVESNMAASYHAFRYLSPLAMDNVIYQLHLYAPNPYTHQGIIGWPTTDGGAPLAWPGEYRGEKWDKDYLRRTLAHVRDFQIRHHARIYVGEFSAAAWAPGADQYLRDCIDLFEEYGWDWTYHAFREWRGWDVEKEGPDADHMAPANADTPRKRALLDGFRR